MVRALLFDFDGVVVDTEVPTFESWRRIYAQHGVDLDLADWVLVVGSGTWDAIVCANGEHRLQADAAMAFEDSPTGVRGAREAGIRCVAIPNRITRDESFADADLVLDSLAERRLTQLLADLGSRSGPSASSLAPAGWGSRRAAIVPREREAGASLGPA